MTVSREICSFRIVICLPAMTMHANYILYRPKAFCLTENVLNCEFIKVQPLPLLFAAAAVTAASTAASLVVITTLLLFRTTVPSNGPTNWQNKY